MAGERTSNSGFYVGSANSSERNMSNDSKELVMIGRAGINSTQYIKITDNEGRETESMSLLS